MKILFLTPHPFDDPSSRLRVYQYFDNLQLKCIKFDFYPFTDESFFKKLMKRDKLSFSDLIKIIAFYLKRIWILLKAPCYDIIFIHRELAPFCTRLLDFILLMLCKRVIYDFDDAVFATPSHLNRFSSKLREKKTSRFWCKHAKAVITGNAFLENYAKKYSNKTRVIPTAVNLDRYCQIASMKKSKEIKDNIVIGWIGSPDSFFYIHALENVLFRLQNEYNLSFHVVGSDKGNLENVEIKRYPWSYDKEIEYLAQFDIGIYPISNDEFSIGKSGYKAILYMACGIPCIASRIGANIDIIEDGENGFLADDPLEWETKLRMLLESSDLREKFKNNGLKTVSVKFSTSVIFPKLYKVFEEICLR